MSTRQRFTQETTAEPAIGATRLVSHAVDRGTPPIEDIAAHRLRELAERVSNAAMPLSGANDDGKLEEADTEFEPVSLATILALGREQTPDSSDDALADATETTGTVAPLAVVTSAPVVPVTSDDEIAPPTPPATREADAAEPLQVTGEVLEATDDIPPTLPSEDSTVEIVSVEEGLSTADAPLMLADQSAPDIRLVDLIRRQQSLLDQLNSFPPSYEALDKAHGTKEAEAAAPAPRSLVEQLAPPPVPPPAPAPTNTAREAPPPLPPFEIAALPPPRPSKSAAREHREEPSEAELPRQSPMIIQRARAERSGRRAGPAVAAPPSAVPAFLGGLALALVVAGVLFAVL